MHTWDPERDSIERYDTGQREAIVRRAIVAEDVRLKIRNVSPWMMTSQIAERYRDGRIFLAGDSAHRFPPTGGLGLNTGVQDAHNLVWKIAAVERGWAGPPLLDTYEEERQPIARYNAEQSLRNAARMFEVPEAMGTNAEPDAAQRSFTAMLGDPARRQGVCEAIANQAEHFDMLGLQLGYSYESGALIADGTAPSCPPNPVRDFVPSSRPGARLPHGWVEREGRRISTLDLIETDRCTLLAGLRGSTWLEAAKGLDGPLRSLRIGLDVDDPENWWTSVAQMDPDGALLVRPDQHVAFRCRGSAADAPSLLRRVVSTVLRRQTEMP